VVNDAHTILYVVSWHNGGSSACTRLI
jgi:hypothetical protein